MSLMGEEFQLLTESTMDNYLKPVEAAFGQHKGLNADWCTMAWPVCQGRWLLDDESCEETVSLVTLAFDADDEPIITTVMQGTVEEVLPTAQSLHAA